jgi:hypothetical protein
MTDTPTTAAGRDHHDLAWSKDTVMPCDHTFSRDICPGCAHDRAIEQEAVTRALDALRAWLIEQSEAARVGAENPSGGSLGDTEAAFDRGARHMADGTLTWISTNLPIEQAKGAERCVVCAHSMDEHRTPGSECIHARCTCDLSEDIVREFVKGTPEASSVAPSDGLREALAEAEGVLTDGWALRLTSRPTAGYRAEALYNDKVKVYVVAATPDGALRELSDVITESHIND